MPALAAFACDGECFVADAVGGQGREFGYAQAGIGDEFEAVGGEKRCDGEQLLIFGIDEETLLGRLFAEKMDCAGGIDNLKSVAAKMQEGFDRDEVIVHCPGGQVAVAELVKIIGDVLRLYLLDEHRGQGGGKFLDYFFVALLGTGGVFFYVTEKILLGLGDLG